MLIVTILSGSNCVTITEHPCTRTVNRQQLGCLPASLSLYLFLLSSLAFFLSCPRRRQSPIAHNDYVLGGRAVGLAERRGDGTKAAEGEEREGGGRGGRLGRVLSPLLSKLVNVMRPPPLPPRRRALTLPTHTFKRICSFTSIV